MEQIRERESPKKSVLVQLSVSRVVLLINHGSTDKISLTLEEIAGFPSVGYETCANIEVQKGYGEYVCRELGVVPEVIDAKPAPRVPFSK